MGRIELVRAVQVKVVTWKPSLEDLSWSWIRDPAFMRGTRLSGPVMLVHDWFLALQSSEPVFRPSVHFGSKSWE